MENKNITSYEWGAWWAEQLGCLEFLDLALTKHGKPLLPHQRRAFERGFRDAIAKQRREA